MKRIFCGSSQAEVIYDYKTGNKTREKIIG